MEMLEKPVLLFDRNTGQLARLRYSCPDFTGILKTKFKIAAFVPGPLLTIFQWGGGGIAKKGPS